MLKDFNKFISDNNLVGPSDKVLMALSGGIDSMVMSHLFRQTGTETGIAHCNFTLRAAESDKDEDMVRKYAEQLEIPFYSVRFETEKYATQKGLSVQMAARELRYEWFEKIRKENGYNTIAVAHNLNDNIETLLINLTRGTGIAGLTGMRPAANNIIRPLLFATRQVIADYCSQHRIIYREDVSNAGTKYIRNKIRHLVIPVLKEINPSVENTLNETAERLYGINTLLTEYISEIRQKVAEEKDELIMFNCSPLKTYAQNSSLLFELFKPYAVSNVQLNDLRRVIEGRTGSQIFTDTHRIIKNRKVILITPKKTGEETSVRIDNLNELRRAPGILSAALADITAGFEILSNPKIASIDYAKITFPLVIRKWKAGDHFYPLGMSRKKKLSDYFIDNKYSMLKKENCLILECAGRIVWIIGDRIDNRFSISSSTKKALIIKSV